MPRRARRSSELCALALMAVLITAAPGLAGCTADQDRSKERNGTSPASAARTASPPPRGSTPYERRGAFAVGNTVHIGARTVPLRISGQIDSLAYTSAGVVASALEPGQDVSRGRSKHTYHLVRPGGAVVDLGLVLDGIDTTTDSDAPYLAWVSGRRGEWQVHVRDVSTGEETRVPVRGRTTLAARTPSVLLDGDTAFVLLDDPVAVDWRTGETVRAEGLDRFSDAVADGRVAYPARFGPGDAIHARVLDAVTGDVLVELEEQSDGNARLSPDGRLVRTSEVVPSNGPRNRATFAIHDLDTQSTVTVREHDYRWFWTPDGSVFRVNPEHIDLCATGTADCRMVPATLGDGSWTMPEDAQGM